MSYTPKPDDAVKATLGESVIYGTVDVPVTEPWVYIIPEGQPDTYITTERGRWSYEPWVKPVTFKPLAVVRVATDAPSEMFIVEPYWTDADRVDFDTPVVVYRYDENEWTSINGLVDLSDATVARALAHGKAEVLFAGVEDDTTGVEE